MVSSPMFSYLLSKPARAMLIFWCLYEAQAAVILLFGQLRGYTVGWVAIVYPSFNFIVITTHTNHCLNQPQFVKVCDEQVCLTDENAPLHLTAAPFSPPCIQGDFNISTTYSEIVFEKCLISPEFGPEWLGTLLSQDLFSLFSVLAGILTLTGF